MLVPRPSWSTAPSIWYDAVAAPKAKSAGKRAASASVAGSAPKAGPAWGLARMAGSGGVLLTGPLSVGHDRSCSMRLCGGPHGGRVWPWRHAPADEEVQVSHLLERGDVHWLSSTGA